MLDFCSKNGMKLMKKMRTTDNPSPKNLENEKTRDADLSRNLEGEREKGGRRRGRGRGGEEDKFIPCELFLSFRSEFLGAKQWCLSKKIK